LRPSFIESSIFPTKAVPISRGLFRPGPERACGSVGSPRFLIQVKTSPAAPWEIDGVKMCLNTEGVMDEKVTLRNETPSPRLASKRLSREWATVAAMVRCYCRGRHHADGELCAECQGLLDYAALRLERCRFGPEKPTCARCPVHCYQRERREQIKAVMRYAGPRMLWLHPILSLRHWWDSRVPRAECGVERKA
jgi:hypothetical protein